MSLKKNYAFNYKNTVFYGISEFISIIALAFTFL